MWTWSHYPIWKRWTIHPTSQNYRSKLQVGSHSHSVNSRSLTENPTAWVEASTLCGRTTNEKDTPPRKRQRSEEDTRNEALPPTFTVYHSDSRRSTTPTTRQQHTDAGSLATTSPKASLLSLSIHSLPPPRTLFIAEELFSRSRAYFDYSCQNMIFDEDENLLLPDGAELRNDMCNNFDSYCFTLTMSKGQTRIARRLFSKAKTLVPEIIRAQHPRTLAYFLEVCIHFIQSGYSAISFSLVELIKRESERVIAKDHP